VGEIIACIGAAKYVPDTGKHASRAVLLLKKSCGGAIQF
jgi:hypothetical protein